MAKPVPPKIAPKPGKVTVLRALYGYTAQQEDELTFNEGDVLYLVDQTDANWWKARCGMKVGLIPSNYGKVEMRMDTIENPVHDAARRGNVEFLKECLNNGNKLGDTPLHGAASKDHVPIVSLLLENGADPTLRNKDGQRPVDLCHDPKVKVLLERSVGKVSYSGNDEADEDYLNDSYDEDEDGQDAIETT